MTWVRNLRHDPLPLRRPLVCLCQEGKYLEFHVVLLSVYLMYLVLCLSNTFLVDPFYVSRPSHKSTYWKETVDSQLTLPLTPFCRDFLPGNSPQYFLTLTLTLTLTRPTSSRRIPKVLFVDSSFVFSQRIPRRGSVMWVCHLRAVIQLYVKSVRIKNTTFTLNLFLVLIQYEKIWNLFSENDFYDFNVLQREINLWVCITMDRYDWLQR